MSITDCHLSIQTFWRCKYSVLRSPPGYTDSLSTRVSLDGQSMAIYQQKRGRKKKEMQSQERKYSLKNKQESLGWGWRGAQEEETAEQTYCSFRKHPLRQLQSQYML